VLVKWKFRELDKFAESLNDVFEHFGVNLILTRNEFVERQDPKITNQIIMDLNTRILDLTDSN